MEATATTPVNFTHPWENFSQDIEAIDLLEKRILHEYLIGCRWFGGKARKLGGICIDHVLSITSNPVTYHLLVLKAKYRTGRSENYLLPVALASQTEDIPAKGIIASSNYGWVIDAIYDAGFRTAIFNYLYQSSKIKQHNGALFFQRGSAFHESDYTAEISSRVLDADQSNSSLIYGEKFFLKLYRKLFRETNPDVEVVQFLTEKAHFTHIPSFAGTFFWKKAYGAPITLGMMQQKVSAIKDVWSLAGDYLNEYLIGIEQGIMTVPASSIEQARILGLRTAEMHSGLASDANDAAFAPEAYSDEYTDWLLNNCESLLKRRLRVTKDCYAKLDDAGKELSKFFISNASRIRDYFSRIKTQQLQSLRTRIHGDYHLGQVLYDGNDYIILDFEGEPESSIADRKIKHSPLKDVAGMLRSFHYAVSAKLYFSAEAQNVSKEIIDSAVAAWYKQVTEAYLNSYWEMMKDSVVLKAEQSELEFILKFHLLEKAVYELGYELNARPTWVKIPLKGIQQVLSQLA